MKNYTNTALSLLLLPLLVAGCDIPSAEQTGTEKKIPLVSDTSKVLATVNGSPVTDQQYEVFVRSINNEVPLEDIDPAKKERIINEMVDRQLLQQYAIKWGLDKEVRLAIALEQQRQLLLALAAKKNILENDIKVTEKQLKDRYKLEKENAYPTEYHIQHINVATEEEAKDIIGKLDNGGNFRELATELSLDKSKENGGDLGWVQKASILPQIFDSIGSMEKGSYSKTPVQTQAGWQILKLVDSRPVTFLEFEQAKERLLPAIQRELLMKKITTMRDAAKIEFSKM
ncbi:MAG: peptidylprolyl isomerase [Gammaproteobacteria bacterium]|nr:MAG: peptidylprolyl isomerase [Gammaproteobacteria bacterium]